MESHVGEDPLDTECLLIGTPSRAQADTYHYILQPHNLDHNETGDHLLGTKAQYGNVTTFKAGLKALISLFHLRDTTANAVGFLKKNFVSSLKNIFISE